jgi:peptidoglycan/LPS O-acetylase OafA/YrhL
LALNAGLAKGLCIYRSKWGRQRVSWGLVLALLVDRRGTSVSTTSPRQSSLHLPGLDGVRGVAILLILIMHLGVMRASNPTEIAVFKVISACWIGVELFFVLSGTLITGILLDAKYDTSYYKDFYVRRVIRIFPLYYILLIFSFYILPLVSHPKMANFSRVQGDEAWYWVFLQNYAMAMAGGPRHAIMDVTWSLAIEEQFYLIWPFVIRALSTRRLGVVCAAAIAFSLSLRLGLVWQGVSPWVIYVLTPTRLDGLLAGALVAIAIRSPALTTARLDSMARTSWLSGALMLAAVVWVSHGLEWDDPIVQTFGYTALAVMFAGLVMSTVLQAGSRTPLSLVMEWGPLTVLGGISYGLYLVHLPLRALVRDAIFKPATFPDFFGGTLVAQLVFYCVSGALAISVAWCVFHGFEKRFFKWKPKLAAPVALERSA